MESITIEIVNPKAMQPVRDLSEIKIVTISMYTKNN